jgi:hypothetical protein
MAPGRTCPCPHLVRTTENAPEREGTHPSPARRSGPAFLLGGPVRHGGPMGSTAGSPVRVEVGRQLS